MEGSMFYRLKPFTPFSQTIKLTTRVMNFHWEIYSDAHREIQAILFGQFFWCCGRNMNLQACEIWNSALKDMIPVAIFFCDNLVKLEWLWLHREWCVWYWCDADVDVDHCLSELECGLAWAFPWGSMRICIVIIRIQMIIIIVIISFPWESL